MIVCAKREEVDEMDVDLSFSVVADQEEMLEELGQESTLCLKEQKTPSGDEVTK